jgi:large subunit ribosomal protein L4
VLGEPNKNVYLSARNLKGTNVVNFNELSTYSIMNNKGILLSEGSVKEIENILSK